MLPGGARGATIRALHRAVLGRADAAGHALRIEVTERPDADEVSERAQELAHEYRAVVEEILEARGNPGVAAFLRSIDHPGHLADTAGYSPDLSFERKLELLETLDVEERLVKAIAWAREALGEIELRRRIRDDVTDGMEQARSASSCSAGRWTRSEKSWERATTRTRSPATASGSPRFPCPTRPAARPSARSAAWPPRAATAPRHPPSARISTGS